MPDAMKARVYAMLVALSHGPAHGYGLKKEIEASSEGAIRLGPATLYRTLAELEELGWIRESANGSDRDEGDERRRYYRLTELGEEALRRETERLASLVRTVQRSPVSGAEVSGG